MMSRATIDTRARAVLLGAVVAATLLFPSAPSAQEKGVHIDPNSPAGREYAVPVDEARRDAGGSDNDHTGSAPLFGEGVSGDDGGASGSGSSRDAGESKGKNRQGTSAGSTASSVPKSDLVRLAKRTDDSGGSTLPLFIGIAVLLLGVTGGIVGRRRRTTS